MTAQLGNVDCYAELLLVGRMKGMPCASRKPNCLDFVILRKKQEALFLISKS